MHEAISLTATISGSFIKFKREIDLAIEEFRDSGVEVLAPESGWLVIPKFKILTIFESKNTFNPLPSEVGMTPKQVEDKFLNAISRSKILYVINPEGYVGNIVTMEIGFAIAMGVPVCCKYPINQNLDMDPLWQERMASLPVMPIAEVVKLLKERYKY